MAADPHGLVDAFVTMLNEHDGKTVVTVNMEHATRVTDKTEEEALTEYQAQPSPIGFWRDHFIPTLKDLVDQEK